MAGTESFETASETETSLDSTFIFWLDTEDKSVSKIMAYNVEKIETTYTDLIEMIKRRGSSLKKQVHENRASITVIEPEVGKTCTADEISNNIAKYQEILTQIWDYKAAIFKLESKIIPLKTKNHTNYNDCKSRIIAHKKAIGCVESLFNVKITLVTCNDGRNLMRVIFQNIKQHPATIVFDQNYNVISFEINSLPVDNYKELKNWFNSTTPNPTNLIIRLRKYVMNLK